MLNSGIALVPVIFKINLPYLSPFLMVIFNGATPAVKSSLKVNEFGLNGEFNLFPSEFLSSIVMHYGTPAVKEISEVFMKVLYTSTGPLPASSVKLEFPFTSNGKMMLFPL